MISDHRVSRIQSAVLMGGVFFGIGMLWLTELAFGTVTVNITATVNTTVSCSSVSTSTLSFGTLSSGSISATAPGNVSSTLACTDGSGCSLFLNDVGSSTTGGGMATTSPAYLIPSPNAAFNATATLVAGTEGYGVQAATTSAGAGGTLTLAIRYNFATSTHTVGGLTTSTLTLASTTSAITTAREVLTYPQAAISATTPGGSYSDTLTYSCSGF